VDPAYLRLLELGKIWDCLVGFCFIVFLQADIHFSKHTQQLWQQELKVNTAE